MGAWFDEVVEVDETYIGGKARNIHADRRRALDRAGKLKGHGGKTAVMGFYERGGKVRLTVINSTKRDYLRKQVRRHVKPEAHVMTDALSSYQGLDAHYVHKVIDHAEKYAEGLAHANGLENFWSLLKRGLGGTYVCVRPFHMFRYLDERAYRYNYRDGSDADRFELALGRAPGRRVTWDELTSNAPEPEPTPPPPAIVGAAGCCPSGPSGTCGTCSYGRHSKKKNRHIRSYGEAHDKACREENEEPFEDACKGQDQSLSQL